MFHRKVIRPIKQKYVIGACEESLFSFTGWNLEQNEEGITVTQRDYLNDLDLDQFETLMKDNGKNEDRLDKEQLELMQKANGILGWLAQVSKPDLAYAYVEFSSILKRATIGDAKRLIRMLKNARADLDTIKFSNLGDVKNWRIKVYCDASFAKLNNVDTVTGDLVTVEGEGGAMAILEWTSTKLKVPANSPLNGESEAAMAAQVVEEDNMTISWLSGALQPADILTKPAVNSRIVKTLMRSEMFGMPMVFMIWFFLMMMLVRFDLQFFSLNAVKERIYDSVNKEVVE